MFLCKDELRSSKNSLRSFLSFTVIYSLLLFIITGLYCRFEAMVVLFSTTNGKGCFARPSSVVIYSPFNQLFDAIKCYRLLCKVYGIVVEFTHICVSFSNALLLIQDKISIDLLKVRFVDCLLGIPCISLHTLTPDPSAQHNLYKLKEVLQPGRHIFILIKLLL